MWCHIFDTWLKTNQPQHKNRKRLPGSVRMLNIHLNSTSSYHLQTGQTVLTLFVGHSIRVPIRQCGIFQWQTWPRYHWRISSGAASAWTPTPIPSPSRVDTTSAWIASKATGTRRTGRSVRCAKRRSKSDRSWGSTELFPTWLNSSKGLFYFQTLCVPIPVSLLPLYKYTKSEGSNVRC